MVLGPSMPALAPTCASTQAAPAVHTACVEATTTARTWHPWTIWLPCVLASHLLRGLQARNR
jgi:hypothetical protein